MASERLAHARRIADDRSAGASELLAQLLPLLADAIAAGPGATLEVVRCVCGGQPAMAPIWNACALAWAEHAHPGRFARVREELMRVPHALRRAALFALRDLSTDVTRPRLLTLSSSASVAGALAELANERVLEVVCGESLPGGEGRRVGERLSAAGAAASVVHDAELTTYLNGATGVVVGADAISAADWTNKCGTLGLAAAAQVTGVPVYVIAARNKAQSRALRAHAPLPPIFERTPIALATAVVTEAGVVTPPDLPAITERFAVEVAALLEQLDRG